MNQSPFGYLPTPPPKKSTTPVILIVVLVVLFFGGCEAMLMLGVFEPSDHARPIPSSAPTPAPTPIPTTSAAPAQ
jgi:flagellar basal body-associated protein FliL